MLKIFSLFVLAFTFQQAYGNLSPIFDAESSQAIVTETKKITLPTFPGAFNPSLVKYSDGYLMTFRYLPNRFIFPMLSYIGVVRLNKSFDTISATQLIDTRFYNNTTPSQSEDARIFSSNGKIYLIYNDNIEISQPSMLDKRDMYIAELIDTGNEFYISDPLKLTYKNYEHVLWQKNWNPFEWNGSLFLSYTINPHEIIYPNFNTGECKRLHVSMQPIKWDYGSLRGGSPALMVDGEYLAFFHSAAIMSSPSSYNWELWHYFMGAYTFSSEPPFELTSVSTTPIDAPEFYTYSNYEKRVIYPGGYVLDDSKTKIYVAYGKDDSELWIATIDLKTLKNSMIPLKHEINRKN